MQHGFGRWIAIVAVLLLGRASVGLAANGCSDLLKLAIPGGSIDKAQEMPAGPVAAAPGSPPSAAKVPEHCRVDGMIGAHTGRDGKPYGIRFAVALPSEWNGRLLYQGGGGLNGSVQAPLGAAAAGDTPAIVRGFAVVSSDSGHESGVFDAGFLADQQAALDFLYQSIGKVMAAARPIVAAHYGSSAAHSYFVGCSTGGREAMIAAQRYPQEFDGIVAGDPAMRTNYSNLALRWVTASLNAAAPKDAQGHFLTEQALPDSDRKLFVDALLKACDALDGVRDGMIFNSKGCAFDPQVLVCKGAKNDGCLSAIQVSAVKRAFAGPIAASGHQVYPGFAYDTGIGASGRGIPGLLSGGRPPEGGMPTGAAMDVDAEAAIAHEAREMMGDTDAWTNLSSFAAHNGKLLLYHGLSDPWFSPLETLRYYTALGADPSNGTGPVAQWSRLFLVPGMAHCGGGEATLDHFDMLSAIVTWAEQGQAPSQVIATGTAYPGRSRPLCPYPQHAQYIGHGDSESAGNFMCRD